MDCKSCPACSLLTLFVSLTSFPAYHFWQPFLFPPPPGLNPDEGATPYFSHFFQRLSLSFLNSHKPQCIRDKSIDDCNFPAPNKWCCQICSPFLAPPQHTNPPTLQMQETASCIPSTTPLLVTKPSSAASITLWWLRESCVCQKPSSSLPEISATAGCCKTWKAALSEAEVLHLFLSCFSSSL